MHAGERGFAASLTILCLFLLLIQLYLVAFAIAQRGKHTPSHVAPQDDAPGDGYCDALFGNARLIPLRAHSNELAEPVRPAKVVGIGNGFIAHIRQIFEALIDVFSSRANKRLFSHVFPSGYR